MSQDQQKALLESALRDPQVQAMVREKGQAALQDPAVQAQILDYAKANGGPALNFAKEQIMQFGQDPVVQAQAKHYASQAGVAFGQAAEHGVSLVEQGPTGVRLLAFLAGCASCVCSVMTFLDVGNLLGHLPAAVVAGYQIVFSVSTMVFEAPPSVIEKVPGLTGYQDLLIDHVKAMSEVMGRGLFYIFQGTLWWSLSKLHNILNIAVGGALIFIGFLHVAMYYGKLDTVAAKMRQGYQAASQRASGP
jgi:hypothetical protein